MGQLDIFSFAPAELTTAAYKTLVKRGHVVLRSDARATLDRRLMVSADITDYMLGVTSADQTREERKLPNALMFVDVAPLKSIYMCPTCENERTLRKWRGHVVRYGFRMLATGRKCTHCGDVLLDVRTLRAQERAIAPKLVARGLRNARRFKLARRIAGVSREELATAYGQHETTVDKWETGRSRVPVAAAYLMSELVVHPRDTRIRLARIARVQRRRRCR